MPPAAAATPPPAGGPPSAHSLSAEAYQRLYPDEYYASFLDKGIRPDGRTLTQPRPVTVATGVVGTADGSALVRVGGTSVVAGARAEVARPDLEVPEEGYLDVTVELSGPSHTDARPGRQHEQSALLTERVRAAVADGNCVDLTRLAIRGGLAAWAIYVDVVVLSADGGLLEASLLAALAALATLEIADVDVTEEGNVVRRRSGAGASPSTGGEGAGRGESEPGHHAAPSEASSEPRSASGPLLRALPHATSFSIHRGRLVTDPTAEELLRADGRLDVVVGAGGRLLSLTQPGAGGGVGRALWAQALAAAEARRAEVCLLLADALPDGLGHLF